MPQGIGQAQKVTVAVIGEICGVTLRIHYLDRPVCVVVSDLRGISHRIDCGSNPAEGIDQTRNQVPQRVLDRAQVGTKVIELRGLTERIRHRRKLPGAVIAEHGLMIEGIGGAGQIAKLVVVESRGVAERIRYAGKLIEFRLIGEARGYRVLGA